LKNLIGTAGFPAAIQLAGISPVTILPAPMIELSPIIVPLRITEFIPIHTLHPIITSLSKLLVFEINLPSGGQA
jgi:hypothetical protein